MVAETHGHQNGGSSCMTNGGDGETSPLANISEIYRQLSRKGILSNYGHLEAKKSLNGTETTNINSQHHTTSPPLPPHPHPHPPPQPSSSSSSSSSGDEFDVERATDPQNIPIKISIMEDAEEGVPVKPSALSAVRDLHLLAAAQVLRSAVRNSGCFAFVACAVYLAAEGSEFFQELHLHDVDGRIVVLVLLAVGVVAVVFQVLHILSEFKGRGRNESTLVAHMLRHPVTQAKFSELYSQLREAVPYLGAEIRLPRRRMIWSRSPLDDTSRKLNTVFRYDSWGDASSQVNMANISKGDYSGWLILGKDYRLSGITTETWLQEELNKFKESVDFTKHRWRTSLEFVLDLQEGMNFPDAQAFLIHPSAMNQRSFYSFRVYAVLLCMCLDSVYNVLFHIVTKRFPDQRIIKVIKRSIGHNSQ